MKLIIDLTTNAIVGGSADLAFSPTSQQILIDPPAGFEMSTAAEWVYDGVGVTQDASIVLSRAKTSCKERIKAEAARLIAATDWKVTRAKEREAGGWATLAEVDAVLAERESIRRSSSSAEATLDALTDVTSVTAFSWSVDVDVTIPRRLTQTQFLDRFTDAEATAVLGASAANPSLQLFWQKMTMADWINLDAPSTQAGVNALEIAGLLAPGRALQVLA